MMLRLYNSEDDRWSWIYKYAYVVLIELDVFIDFIDFDPAKIVHHQKWYHSAMGLLYCAVSANTT